MKRLLIMIPLIAACGDTAPAKQDLANDKQTIVQTDVTVWNMPDDFPNVVFFCNNLTGVYINTRDYDPVNLMANDPACWAPDTVPG